MTRQATVPSTFLADFERFAEADEAVRPWLATLRRRSFDRFLAAGLPSPRHEDWKYTDARPLGARAFPLASAGASATEADVLTLGLGEGPTLVFVDGRLDAALSRRDGLPAGASLSTLVEALAEDEADLRDHLASVADTEGHAFAALNAAFLSDGACLRLDDGVSIEEPVRLLFLASRTPEARRVHPRVLVVVGAGSRATIVEAYGRTGTGEDGPAFTNAVAEYVLGEGAALRVLRLQHEGGSSCHVGTTAVRQAGDSRFGSTCVSMGGTIARHEIHVDLEAPGAETELDGLYVLANQEHVDNHIVVEHRVPHGTSRQRYKGILGDRSTGAFTGRVVVHPHAQKTDARQANHSLLLSREALAETRPQLEIYADDVQCAHGATIGQLDEEAVYYLRSRGLGVLAARNLLIRAFAGEITDGVEDEGMRACLEALLAGRLRTDAQEDLET